MPISILLQFMMLIYTPVLLSVCDSVFLAHSAWASRAHLLLRIQDSWNNAHRSVKLSLRFLHFVEQMKYHFFAAVSLTFA